tara:strand:- start:187 stop:816 length:630 start_codon:yes stop_codon:yes gene_type:complete
MKLVQLNSITNFKFQTMKTMKTMKKCSMYALLAIAMIGCSDDDAAPLPINEEEVITTVILTLTPESGDQVVLTTIDLDGDGPDEPETTVSGSFLENTEYQGAVRFLNETETPAEEITDEVLQQADHHQVFYEIQGGLDIGIMYNDDQQDTQGNPIGLQITLTTGAASSGSLTVTLRHEPNKSAEGVSDGDITNAGGETDITTTFNVSIQ